MKAYWNCTKEQLEEMFGFREKGLTEEEVERIRKETGENRLSEGRHKSLLQVFLSQFCDLMVIILIIAAIISMFSGNVESTIVIFLVLLMNAVLGTIQYRKAEKSLDSLKDLAAPAARVIRDGKRQEIASKEIVPGDYVILEAGDMIVADGRILRNYSLQVNEGSLTGESVNVEKNEEVLPEEVPLADRKNMVFSGSFVTYGRAEVLVTATGMETELGKIAGLMNQTKERKTPLQISLDSFSKKLAILIMAICALVFCLGIYRKMPVIDAMMFAVALAVAAIPEALGSIATGGTGNGGPGNVTDNQGTEGTENGGTTQDAQGNEDTTTIGDEDTPKADQDLKDLDDEDVPKSDKDLDGNKKVKKSLPLVAGVGTGVAALAALAAGIVIVRKRVRR